MEIPCKYLVSEKLVSVKSSFLKILFTVWRLRYTYSLDNVEVACHTSSIVIENEFSHEKSLHKTAKQDDLCAQTLNQADSSTTWCSLAMNKLFPRVTELEYATNYTFTDSINYLFNRRKSSLQLSWPEHSSHRIKKPLLLTSLSRKCERNPTEVISSQCNMKYFQFCQY